jgi:hypothetical protein
MSGHTRDFATATRRRITASGLLTLGLLMLLTGCSTHRQAIDAAQRNLQKTPRTTAADTIVLSDLDRLPAPVRTYLIKSKVVGKQHLRTFRGKFSGEMKLGEKNSKWMPVKFTQYSFVDTTLTRVFYIKARMFGILPVVGLDKYENGRGTMLIRPLDLFTVVNESGPAMDRAELVTFLNDMSMFPMALLNKKVRWEALSDTSARATLVDCGMQVAGIFYFDRQGDLVNFETDDRMYNDGRGDIRKAKWLTPLRKHTDFNGVRIASQGDAVWDFGDHRFHYARLVIRDVGYNNFALY